MTYKRWMEWAVLARNEEGMIDISLSIHFYIVLIFVIMLQI